MTLTLDEVKTHLRIEQDEEDEYLDGLIRYAQAAAEDYCRVIFTEEAPESVRLAMLVMVSHFYTYRENEDKTAYDAMMSAFHTLLYPNRDPELMFG